MAKLYAVEGLDAVGKTTLCEELRKAIGCVVLYSLPTQFTEARKRVMTDDVNFTSRFLYYLSGVVAMQTQVINTLMEGKNVVLDRSIYSTIACHRAYGVDTNCVDLHSLGILWPQKTILLTADESVRYSRLKQRGEVKTHELDTEFQIRAGREYDSFKGLFRIDTSFVSVEETVREAIAYLDS